MAAAGRERPDEPLPGDDDGRARLGEHEGEPLPGPGRVEGQEGGARLERPQDGDHHLGGSLHGDRHEDVGRGAEPSQVPCQPVGATVQLTISETSAFEDHGDRVGRAFDLDLEELVHAQRDARGCGVRGDRRN